MKKTLALIMALALVFSLGTAAFAAHTGDDGTESSAAVGAQDASNVTDFYLKIANTESETLPEINVSETKMEGNFAFVVDSKDSSTSSFSVTAPLYVCMYAYGKTGTVVAPADSAYAVSNSSTQSTKVKVSAITKYSQAVANITELQTVTFASADDTTGSRDCASNDDIKTTYAYFSTVDPSKVAAGTTLKALYDLVNNTDNKYFYYENDGTTLKGCAADATKTLDDAEGRFVQVWAASGTDNKATVDGVEYTLNGDYPGTAEGKKAIQVKINSVEATTSDWSLVSETPSNAKELYMTINGLDLALASGAPYETSGSKWIIAAGSISGNTVTANATGLTVNAAIAPDKNDAGEAQVVSVAYTIAAYEGT